MKANANLTPEVLEHARAMREKGLGVRSIARELQVSRDALRWALERKSALNRHKAWTKKNPRRWYAICLRSHLKSKYNLTLEDLHRMFENQEGLCFICSSQLCLCDTKNCPTRACIDHDHSTNKIRGLLCKRCNRLLGIMNDSPTLLRNAVGYLETASAA
jgi:hypothetical protein